MLMILYDSYRLPKEEAVRMMYDVGMKMLESTGIEIVVRQISFPSDCRLAAN